MTQLGWPHTCTAGFLVRYLQRGGMTPVHNLVLLYPLLFLQDDNACEPSSEVPQPVTTFSWKMSPAAQLPSISEIRFSVSFSIIFC